MTAAVPDLFPSSEIGRFGRRQRHPRGHRIAVTIAALPKQHDGVVIMVDSFGTDDVAPLPGGCACCTVRVELQAALRRLLKARTRKPFTRVTIETGEDIGAILRTFASERALGTEFYVEDIPTTAIGAHDSRIRHFVLTETSPLSWDAFSHFIATLVALRGADLLHVQGLLNVTGCQGPVAVQYLQHLAHRPIELEAWPDEDRASRLAFITRGVEETAVRSLFDAIRKL